MKSIVFYGIKIAVKTGTSNGEINSKIVAKDIWTVGYTPNLSMAVWLGNPDTTPLSAYAYSTIPAILFDKTMTDVTGRFEFTGLNSNELFYVVVKQNDTSWEHIVSSRRNPA